MSATTGQGDQPGRSAPGGRPSPTGRRELAYAVLLCLAGAGLAVWATTRPWAVEVTLRPAPLPELRTERSGAAMLPWLPALALVALAGAGAVLATRDGVRRVVGLVVLSLGGAVAAGGGFALVTGLDGELSRQWPALCLVGGMLVTVGGGWTAWRGASWPAMGARYERPAGASTRGSTPRPTTRVVPGRRTMDAWDALDRGEDPTVS